ncbi:uncharacterized protein LOC135923035 isoform X1 [Gordionus sp. m RMFG-2023]|uniref:uncharacterized protein LOC135923035 isoform X1 n=1 Tax=Gordionus sp. m RMFG-2023 TaxID=3053472 RepID=UPI0031FCF30E
MSSTSGYSSYNKMIHNLQLSTSYNSLVDKIIEGVKMSINIVLVTIYCPENFRAIIELTSVVVQSTSYNWKPCSLKASRISLKEYGTYIHFKEIQWNNTRIEIQIFNENLEPTAHIQSTTPQSLIKIITNQNKLRVVTQKILPSLHIKNSNSSLKILNISPSNTPSDSNTPLPNHHSNQAFPQNNLIFVRSCFMVEDLLWVINETQIPDIIFILSAVLRVSNNYKTLLNSAVFNQPSNPNPLLIPLLSKSLANNQITPEKYASFLEHCVTEEFTQLFINKIDFHLCQTQPQILSITNPRVKVKNEELKSLQVVVESLHLDFYPKHSFGMENQTDIYLQKSHTNCIYQHCLQTYWDKMGNFLQHNEEKIQLAKRSLFQKRLVIKVLGGLKIIDLSLYDIPPFNGVLLYHDESPFINTVTNAPLPIILLDFSEYFYHYTELTPNGVTNNTSVSKRNNNLVFCENLPVPNSTVICEAQALRFICHYDSLAWICPLVISASSLWNSYSFEVRYHTDTYIKVKNPKIIMLSHDDNFLRCGKDYCPYNAEAFFEIIIIHNFNMNDEAKIKSSNCVTETKYGNSGYRENIEEKFCLKTYVKKIKEAMDSFPIDPFRFPEREKDYDKKLIPRINLEKFCDTFYPNFSTKVVQNEAMNSRQKSKDINVDNTEKKKLFWELSYIDKWIVNADNFELRFVDIIDDECISKTLSPCCPLFQPLRLRIWLVPFAVTIKGNRLLIPPLNLKNNQVPDSNSFEYALQMNYSSVPGFEHLITNKTYTESTKVDNRHHYPLTRTENEVGQKFCGDPDLAYFDYRALCRVASQLNPQDDALEIHLSHATYTCLNMIIDNLSDLTDCINSLTNKKLDDGENLNDRVITLTPDKPSLKHAIDNEVITVKMSLFLEDINFKLYPDLDSNQITQQSKVPQSKNSKQFNSSPIYFLDQSNIPQSADAAISSKKFKYKSIISNRLDQRQSSQIFETFDIHSSLIDNVSKYIETGTDPLNELTLDQSQNTKESITSTNPIPYSNVKHFAFFTLNRSLIDIDIWKNLNNSTGTGETCFDFKMWTHRAKLHDKISDNFDVSTKTDTDPDYTQLQSSFDNSKSNDKHKRVFLKLRACYNPSLSRPILQLLIGPSLLQINPHVKLNQDFQLISSQTLTLIAELLSTGNLNNEKKNSYKTPSPFSLFINVEREPIQLKLIGTKLSDDKDTSNDVTTKENPNEFMLKLEPFVLYRLAEDDVTVLTNVHDIKNKIFSRYITEMIDHENEGDDLAKLRKENQLLRQKLSELGYGIDAKRFD